MANSSFSPAAYQQQDGRSTGYGPGSQTALNLISVMPLFLVGVLSGIPIQGYGKLYVGELVLVGLAPVATPLLFGLKGRYGALARLLFIAMLVTLVGYVGSDFYRSTASHDYLRGWSRWIFSAASFASLAWLGSRNINLLMTFVVGWSVGMCAAPFMLGGPAAAGLKVVWKFYAAIPCCISMLYLMRNFRPLFTLSAVLGFALFSVLLDYRSPAFICAVVVGISLFALRNRRRLAVGKSMTMSAVLAATLVIVSCASLSYIAVQFLGEKYGYAERFRNSNSRRIANIEIAYQAISRSPLLGYGSWPRDPEFAKLRDKLVEKKINGRVMRGSIQQDLIITHSQVLQSWVEGGLLGLAFFAVIGVLMARAFIWQAVEGPYMPLTPMMSAILLFNGWHFFFSPYSAEMRIFVPVACVVVCYILDTKSQMAAQFKAAARPIVQYRTP